MENNFSIFSQIFFLFACLNNFLLGSLGTFQYKKRELLSWCYVAGPKRRFDIQTDDDGNVKASRV